MTFTTLYSDYTYACGYLLYHNCPCQRLFFAGQLNMI